ncbi:MULTISPECIES: aldehyde dehydrogenase family protein [unclassified Pseudomonas]|uniref:aldehyde dehydrogenase family protein n=1 Tax=unclassified Pseudomonas TaxID=196821 RepID=UPI0028701C5D|nr:MULTISPECIES: aldehyde dehydrogenase family protein [unclassified Pseudomonas]
MSAATVCATESRPCVQRVPFGGYKRSGNGREYGLHGFEEYLEIKAIVGFG